LPLLNVSTPRIHDQRSILFKLPSFFISDILFSTFSACFLLSLSRPKASLRVCESVSQ
jgi:hypothetical protein